MSKNERKSATKYHFLTQHTAVTCIWDLQIQNFRNFKTFFKMSTSALNHRLRCFRMFSIIKKRHRKAPETFIQRLLQLSCFAIKIHLRRRRQRFSRQRMNEYHSTKTVTQHTAVTCIWDLQIQNFSNFKHFSKCNKCLMSASLATDYNYLKVFCPQFSAKFPGLL